MLQAGGLFGNGWRLVNREVDPQLGVALTGSEALGVFNPVVNGTRLYLTLPNGSRVGFTFAPTAITQSGVIYYEPAWRADSGVTYTLSSTPDILLKAGNRYYDATTGQPYNPTNPALGTPRYILTGPDGTQQTIDATRGVVVQELLPSGAKLFLSDSGITDAAGDRIDFIRNAAGHLESVAVPGGTTVTYIYDASGRLVSASDRLSGNVMQYGYGSDGRLTLVLHGDNTSETISYSSTAATTSPVAGYLGGPALFSGNPSVGPIAAGATVALAFSLDAQEIASTATGQVYLRVTLEPGSGSSFLPAIPTIDGQTPLSTVTRSDRTVALYVFSQPGLYVVNVSGANATTSGVYQLDLRVAGDVNGDGRVDGVDSTLFSAALGSHEGDSAYTFGADLRGDGVVDQGDLQILIDNYGFVATPQTTGAFGTGNSTTARPTPDVPVFDLEAASSAGGPHSGLTTLSAVTLVGQTTPGVTVELTQTGATTTADPHGLFAFLGVPVSAGDNTFTVVATNAQGGSSEYMRTVRQVAAGEVPGTPTLTIALAKYPNGSPNGLTNDPTVTGSVAGNPAITTLLAGVDGSPLQDVTSDLQNGTFTLTSAQLAALLGGPLTDGQHTVHLLGRDAAGDSTGVVNLSFTLLTATPPTPTLTLASGTHVSGSDNLTNQTKPAFQVTGTNGDTVILYVDGNASAQAAINGPTTVTLPTLLDGAHAITAVVEDGAGNISASSQPVTVTISTVAPTTPTLGLDPAFVTAGLPAGATNYQVVTLTGNTDPNLAVALYRGIDLNTPIAATTSDSTGGFSFTNVALATTGSSFRVVATNAAGNTAYTDATFTTTAADTSAPRITASLAHDTSGGSGVTSDPTIGGVIDDANSVTVFQASVDGSAFTSVLGQLHGVGFTLTPAVLASVAGAALADGPHTASLTATDAFNNQSAPVTVTFTLLTARPIAPDAPVLLPSSYPGAPNADHVTNHTTLQVQVFSSSAGLLQLYAGGAVVGSQTVAAGSSTNFNVGPLADGTYLFTAQLASASNVLSLFSTPLQATVDTQPPAAPVFDLDAASDALPRGHHDTNLSSVGFTGETTPGVSVQLVGAGLTATASADGSFSFTNVPTPTVGSYTFTVIATDEAGNSQSATRTIARVPENNLDLLPPTVTLSGVPAVVTAGNSVTIQVAATDNVGVTSLQLTVNGYPLTLDANGKAVYTPSAVGIFDVVATASDAAGNVAKAKAQFKAIVPETVPAPAASFDSPGDTPVVTLPTDVVGSVDGTDLLRYTLAYSPKDKNNWVTFATGTTAVSDNVLGTFDPTLLDNGFYDVRLEVEDAHGGATDAYKVYEAEGRSKVGDFTVSYTDLDVPAPGISFSVTRTYDSKKRNESSDFGYGWSLVTNTMQVTTSGSLGTGIYQFAEKIPSFGTFPPIPGQMGVAYELATDHNLFVNLDLPGGLVEQFEMGYVSTRYSTYGPPMSSTHIFFQAMNSNTTTTIVPLTSDNKPDDQVIISPGQLGAVELISKATGQIYNPTRWKVTTPDGHSYVIDETAGLQSVTNQEGSTLNYSASGVSSSSGFSETYQRDSSGRITSITDQAGNKIIYTYDPAGDLVQVTDQSGQVTRFVYGNPDEPHLLTKAVNGAGITQWELTYDPKTGRVDQVAGTNGNPGSIQYNFGLAPGEYEDTTSVNGVPTEEVHDALGDIVRTVQKWVSPQNPDGVSYLASIYQYDASGHQTAASDTFVVTDPSQRFSYTPANVVWNSRITYDAAGHPLTVTDALGNVTKYTYDANGNETSTTDGTGLQTISTVYDANDNPTQKYDNGVLTQTNTYNQYGELVSSADGNGIVFSTYYYDGVGKLLELTDQNGVTYSYSYDAAGHQTGYSYVWNDPLGISPSVTISTQTKYDASGRVVKETGPDGHWVAHTYDASGNLTQSTDSNGHTETTTYDALGQEIAFTSADGLSQEVVYNAQGQTEVTTAPHLPGQPTTATFVLYDTLGESYETESLTNVTVAIVDDPTHLDSSGAPTKTSVLQTGYQVAGSSMALFDATGRIIGSVDQNGNKTIQELDADGRVTAQIEPAQLDPSTGKWVSQRIETRYDADGRTTATITHILQYADGTIDRSQETETDYYYDADGRPIRTVYPDGSSTQTSYDAQGRKMSDTNQMGAVTNYVYDSQGRLSEVIQPPVPDPYNPSIMVRPVTEYVYDVYGNQTTTRSNLALVGGQIVTTLNPNTPNADDSHTITEVYDAYRQVTSRTLPGGETEYYNYDAEGRVMSHTGFNGVTTTDTYNDFNQLSATSYYQAGADPATATPNQTWTTSYNTFGEPTTVDRGALGDTTTTYSAQGLIESIARPEGQVNYTYDSQKRLESVWTGTDPSHPGVANQYSYDQLGRLASVTQTALNGAVAPSGQGDTVTYQYDPDTGALKAMFYPNGDVTEYFHDVMGRVSEVRELGPSSTPNDLSSYPVLADITYTYYPDGQVQTETDVDPTGTTTTTYYYDALNRLTREVHTAPDPSQSYTTSFTYDLTGNILSKNVLSGVNLAHQDIVTAAYNADAQVTQQLELKDGADPQLSTFAYNGTDLARVTVVDTTTGQTIEETDYTYNLQDLEASVTIQKWQAGVLSSSQTVRYGYDESGSRVSVEDLIDSTGAGVIDTHTVMTQIIDRMNLSGISQVLQETTTDLAGASPTSVRSYLIGLQVQGQQTTVNGSTQKLYLMPDQKGSIRLVSDALGAVLQRFAYDSYGNRIDQSGAPLTHLLYDGQMFDPIIRQYYLRARYYDPSTGRFGQLDPYNGTTGNPTTIPGYTYSNGDPVNRSDPTGMLAGGPAAAQALLGLAPIGEVTPIITNAGPVARVLSALGNLNATVGRLIPAIYLVELILNLMIQAAAAAREANIAQFNQVATTLQPKLNNRATILVPGVNGNTWFGLVRPLNPRNSFMFVNPSIPGATMGFIPALWAVGIVNNDFYNFYWSRFDIYGLGWFPTYTSHMIALGSLLQMIAIVKGKMYDKVNLLGHSWGSVLGETALLLTPAATINNFITVGSPLAGNSPRPPVSGRWVDMTSNQDPVTWLGVDPILFATFGSLQLIAPILTTLILVLIGDGNIFSGASNFRTNATAVVPVNGMISAGTSLLEHSGYLVVEPVNAHFNTLVGVYRTLMVLTSAEPVGPVAPPPTANAAQDLAGVTAAQTAFPQDLGARYSVAVIDSGIDYQLPGLAGRVIVGPDFGDSGPSQLYGSGHGTLIAGLLAGDDPSALGVAPEADIVSLKVTTGQTDSADPSAILAALQWVLDNRQRYNIVTVNLSLGSGNVLPGSATTIFDPLFRKLAEAGVFVAVAAGNDYGPGSVQGLSILADSRYVTPVGAVWSGNVGPASFENGARDYSTAADQILSVSQRGPGLDLLAPGGGVVGLGLNGGLVEESGTSEATALVSGAALLLREEADRLGIHVTPSDIRNLLSSTGRLIYDGDNANTNVPASHLYYHRIDVGAALKALDALAGSGASGANGTNASATAQAAVKSQNGSLRNDLAATTLSPAGVRNSHAVSGGLADGLPLIMSGIDTMSAGTVGTSVPAALGVQPEGDDVLVGGNGNDVQIGGQGRDMLIGGFGSTTSSVRANPVQADGMNGLTGSSVNDLVFSHMAAHGAHGARTFHSASQMEGGSDLAVTDSLFQDASGTGVENVH
jgi:RHS repeat-associated protein